MLVRNCECQLTRVSALAAAHVSDICLCYSWLRGPMSQVSDDHPVAVVSRGLMSCFGAIFSAGWAIASMCFQFVPNVLEVATDKIND